MELGLGRFGDERLQKGGDLCTAGLWPVAARGSASGSWGNSRTGDIYESFALKPAGVEMPVRRLRTAP